MTRICYETLTFTDASLKKIGTAREILAEYSAMGLDCTLRQLYYRFVSRGLIANTMQEYNKLKSLISNARMAGYIDWDVIVDRTRWLRELPHHHSAEALVKELALFYPKWDTQPTYVECWVEKDALIGVLESICLNLDVPYMACRGYASASEIWRAGHLRLREIIRRGQNVRIFYLGDHDPSGIDMTRDVLERLQLFTRCDDERLTVERLALNMDQIKKYEPPPNPTKVGDSRTPEYENEFGDECWELDALDPKVIKQLIESAILQYRSEPEWKKACQEEEKQQGQITAVAEKWEKALKAVTKKPRKRRKK